MGNNLLQHLQIYMEMQHVRKNQSLCNSKEHESEYLV